MPAGRQGGRAAVFVTACGKYAIQAFEANAIDYLLKPFDQGRRLKGIERVRERLEGPDDALAGRLEALLAGQEGGRRQTLAVATATGRLRFRRVGRPDRSRQQRRDPDCRSVDHVFAWSLTSLEQQLDPIRFLRAHRSTVVNTGRTASAYPKPGGVYELELRGESRVTTGRRHREEVRRLLGG